MKLLMVFGLGAVELWAAIPAGLALQLHPVAAGFAAGVGAILGVLAVVLLGERMRAWLMRRFITRSEGRTSGRLDRVWASYGVAGLGLLAPVVTGTPLGAALGMALGAPTGKLLLWMSVGIAAWSVALTAAGTLGLSGLQWLGY